MPNQIWILALEFKFQIRFGTCILVSGTVGGSYFLSDFTPTSSIPVPLLCVLLGIHQERENSATLKFNIKKGNHFFVIF